MKGTSDISGVDRLCPSRKTVMKNIITDSGEMSKSLMTLKFLIHKHDTYSS